MIQSGTHVTIGETAVVPLTLYEMALREIATVHKMLDDFGVPCKLDTLAGRVDCALRLAELKGATWQPDYEEINDIEATLTDASIYQRS